MFLVLLVVAAFVNLIGAFGPELGFDALWYHLTIPKLYLEWGKVSYIPGGLLYYSAMPKLGELLYMLGGANDTIAHLVNWSFGLGTAFIVYKISKKIGLSSFFSFLSSLIFYVTPVVGWLSGSAYVDLIRTFFEALAFYLVISKKYLLAGIILALAIGTKTLAIGSIPILLIIIFFQSKKISSYLLFLAPCFLFSFGWFFWSYMQTGFPFYPIGAGILDQNTRLGIFTWWRILPDADPITPIYLILIPLAIPYFKTLPKSLILYFLLSYLVWFITPRTGGGRFLLPYLPVWAILASTIIKNSRSRLLIYLVVFLATINIGYRVLAQVKLFPYLLGRQTKTDYLCQNLDFRTEVFVDCNGRVAKTVKSGEVVLISGYHNLYYVNFPFIHESWYKNEKVDYFLSPDKFIKL